GPSLATEQLKMSTDRGIKQAMAMASSQQGMSAGARARMAANAGAQLQAEAAGNAAQARIQEQLNARSSLASVLAQGREQDIGFATNQAGLTQGANQANLAAALQAQAQKDQMSQFYRQSDAELHERNRQAQMAYQQMLVNPNVGVHGITSRF